MKTIKLNTVVVFGENSTTKYWREIECCPQEVELNTWSTNHPYFIMTGKVIKSHDIKELGTLRETCVQTYSFFLTERINAGEFTINDTEVSKLTNN